jgi:hypothetical protein
MPGSILLAMPFVALGNSAFQNHFWLAAFVVATSIRFRDKSIALLQLTTLLALAPITLHSIVTGNDLFANSLFVLVAILVVIHVIPDRRSGVWQKLTAAAFIGVAMSSRSNFLLLLPLTVRILAERCGWKTTLRYVFVGAIVFSAVTIPFWLYDPPNFGPLLKQNKFEQYHHVLPHADIVVPGTALILAVILALLPGQVAEHTFWRRCGIIQMYPIAAITCLHMLAVRWPSFRWMIYGQVYLFLGSFAFWLEQAESEWRVQARGQG